MKLIIHTMKNCHRCESLKELIDFWSIKCIIVYDGVPTNKYEYPYAYYKGKRITYCALINTLYGEVKRIKKRNKNGHRKNKR